MLMMMLHVVNYTSDYCKQSAVSSQQKQIQAIREVNAFIVICVRCYANCMIVFSIGSAFVAQKKMKNYEIQASISKALFIMRQFQDFSDSRSCISLASSLTLIAEQHAAHFICHDFVFVVKQMNFSMKNLF